MRRAFRQPGFTRLYVGLTASMFGDSVMLLALSMWVKTITGSNAMAGLTFFFMVIPALFAPLLGVWIDRVKRRPLLVWGHLASGVGVLPLVLVRGEGQVWVIWAVAMLYGVSFVVLPAALNGLLKELVPEEMLVDANSSLQTTKESFRLFGPLIGALLFTWLGGWAIAVLDSASFFAAAAVIATIAVQEHQPEHEDAHFWQQLTAGLRHLAGEPVLKHVLIGFALCILVFGFTESVDLRAARRLRQAGDVGLGDRLGPGRRRDRRRTVLGRRRQPGRRGRQVRGRPGRLRRRRSSPWRPPAVRGGAGDRCRVRARRSRC